LEKNEDEDQVRDIHEEDEVTVEENNF